MKRAALTWLLLGTLGLSPGASAQPSPPLPGAAVTSSGQATSPGPAVRATLAPLLTFQVGGDRSEAARQVRAALARAPQGRATPLSAAVPARVTGQLLRLIAERELAPPPAARTLALTLSALHDAEQLAHTSGRGIDTDTAAQVATTRVLMALFPEDGAALQRALQAQLRPLAPATDRASWALGDAVATGILAFAAQDGAAQAGQSAALSSGEGLWSPLSGQQALEPGWGRVTPIGLTGQALPQVVPPPAWNSPEFVRDRQAFAEQQTRLTAQDLALAQYWAAGAGTVTPLGMWMERALALGQQARLSGAELADLLRLTAVAGHNAFITCWKAKFEYNVARPQSWMSASAGPDWAPPLPTPPFPSYPSGHATVSGAAAEVLAQFFPLQARQLRQQAADAAFSRVVGGIHWSLDGEAGLDAGQRVARAVLDPAKP